MEALHREYAALLDDVYSKQQAPGGKRPPSSKPVQIAPAQTESTALSTNAAPLTAAAVTISEATRTGDNESEELDRPTIFPQVDSTARHLILREACIRQAARGMTTS